MKFTSIKQIPKEAIEMIDDVQWWVHTKSYTMPIFISNDWLSSGYLVEIANRIQPNGYINEYFYIEPSELEDKTYGINLYKKIHGEG